MKSSLETLEGNKVKLSVNVDEAEFDKDIDQAFRKIAQEVRLPGFRNGKAPRRVLEARIGLAPAREQALRDSIPQYLAKAVREHDVDLIASPEVEITGGAEEGPVEFDATCEVRPEITVPGYGGLRVELPSPEATDAEVDEAVTAQLRRQGELVDADRPAATGDFVTLDLAATRDGEEVAGLNTEDWSYEIGQGWVADDFDDQLIGAAAGDELRFTTTPKGTAEPADFVVTVGAVQELVAARGHRRVGRRQHRRVRHRRGVASVDPRAASPSAKLNQARQELVGRVTEALTGLTDIEPPEALVQSDLQRRVEATVRQLQSQGISMDQWMSVTGQDASSFVEGMKGASEQAVKVDLALRAVAAAEQLDADEGDLAAEYERMAVQVGQKPNQVRKAYEQNDLVPELVAQIRKSKALDWLIHHVEMVDPEGNPLDRDVVLGHTHDADGNHLDDEHDHDEHDHDPESTRERRDSRMNLPQLPRPQRRRADQPRRAGLRPLQPAAQGEHHLLADADRRPDRQPDLRPVDPPGVREPGQGHQHLHQQPRWRHHVAVRHLRHDAVHPQRHRHDLPRPGGVGGGGPAGGRHQGQAPGAAALADPAPPAATAPSATARSPISRSPPGRSCACATSSRSCCPSTPASRSSGSTTTPTATSSWKRTRRSRMASSTA